jgi:hypothetical protein
MANTRLCFGLTSHWRLLAPTWCLLKWSKDQRRPQSSSGFVLNQPRRALWTAAVIRYKSNGLAKASTRRLGPFSFLGPPVQARQPLRMLSLNQQILSVIKKATSGMFWRRSVFN